MSKKNINAKYKICDRCGKSFKLKSDLVKHILAHNGQDNIPKTDSLTCFACNLVFKNKGLLVCHNVKVHYSKSSRQSTIMENKYRHICQACQINFFYLQDLKHHIREYHFNLLSHMPYCDFKKVNQVWFEKVMNSKSIVEIKKVAQNILLMRKLDDNTAMKVSEHSTEEIDVRELYPTMRCKTARCSHCQRVYDKRYIKKHITDVHMKYNNQNRIKRPSS